LEPSNAQVRVALRAALVLVGRFEEGIERMRCEMCISPRAWSLAFRGWALGTFLLRVNPLDESLQKARTAGRSGPKLHLPPTLETAPLLRLVRLEREDQTRIALAIARRLRSSISLGESATTHGRRAAKAA